MMKRIPKVSAERIGQLVEINGLRESSGQGVSFRKPESKFYSGDLLPCARKMFEGVIEGCRDVVAFRLAIPLKSRDYRIEQTEQLHSGMEREESASTFTQRDHDEGPFRLSSRLSRLRV